MKKINEGVVTGDHGYDAENIASGNSSGNAVNAGAGVQVKKGGKKSKIKRSKIKSVIVEFKK